MIETFAKLLVFQAIGEGLVHVLSLPVSGPVVGMLLLFAYLVLKEDEAVALAPASSHLLGNMALFFVPAAVGIVMHFHRIADEWQAIAVALMVSTMVSVIVTAAVILWLQK